MKKAFKISIGVAVGLTLFMGLVFGLTWRDEQIDTSYNPLLSKALSTTLNTEDNGAVRDGFKADRVTDVYLKGGRIGVLSDGQSYDLRNDGDMPQLVIVTVMGGVSRWHLHFSANGDVQVAAIVPDEASTSVADAAHDINQMLVYALPYVDVAINKAKTTELKKASWKQ